MEYESQPRQEDVYGTQRIIFTVCWYRWRNGVGTWQNVGGGHIWRAQHRDASHAKVTSQISVGSMPRPKFWVWKWGGGHKHTFAPPLSKVGGGTCPPLPPRFLRQWTVRMCVCIYVSMYVYMCVSIMYICANLWRGELDFMLALPVPVAKSLI